MEQSFLWPQRYGKSTMFEAGNGNKPFLNMPKVSFWTDGNIPHRTLATGVTVVHYDPVAKLRIEKVEYDFTTAHYDILIGASAMSDDEMAAARTKIAEARHERYKIYPHQQEILDKLNKLVASAPSPTAFSTCKEKHLVHDLGLADIGLSDAFIKHTATGRTQRMEKAVMVIDSMGMNDRDAAREHAMRNTFERFYEGHGYDRHEENVFQFFKMSDEPEPTTGKVIQDRPVSELERRRRQAQESKTTDKFPKWLKVKK